MILKVFPFLNVLFCLNAADMTKAHQEGLALANAQKGTVSNQARSINKSDVPGYQTDQPREMHLDQNNLKETAESRKQGDEAANYIQNNSSNPNRKKFDIASDDLLLNAERATEDPLKTMNEIVMEEQGSDASTDEIFECEESGSTYQLSCSKRLEIDLKIMPEIKETKKWCPGHSYAYKKTFHGGTVTISGTNYCNPGCKTRVDIKQEKKVDFVRKEWIDDCGPLEALSEKGFCAYGLIGLQFVISKDLQGEQQ